jgi:hypothetical protein
LARPGIAALLLVLAIAVGVAGCGEDEGVADGATVNAYVEEPLCKRPGMVLVPAGDGDAMVLRFLCLPAARGPGLSQGVGGGRQVDLATAGANARRATEDSTTIAYLSAADPAVNRFTHPILEAAGIGWMTAENQVAAERRLGKIVAAADPSSLRADVREALGQP